MLNSPGGIPPIGPAKGYYPAMRHSAAAKPSAGHNYDSVSFSSAQAGEDAFQMNLISRISQEVRTATTTGDIQALKQAVASGEYTPNPMAIAGKILFLVGG